MDKRILIYMILLGLSFYIIQTFLAPKSTFQPTTPPISSSKVEIKKTELPQQEEEFYLLENEFIQLVFSNIGGALAEINLPLKNKDNKSIVLPIEFDKIIEKKNPENNHFPQKSYFASGFKKMENTKVGGYYPLLRRSIYDQDGNLKYRISPKYYSLNIYDEDNLFSNITYKVTRFDKNLIEFEGKAEETTIIKTYSFDENGSSPYLFNLKLKILGKNRKIWLSSGIPEVDLTSNAFIPVLRYRQLIETKYSTDNISIPKTEDFGKPSYIDWISNSTGFFGIIVDPIGESKGSYISDHISGSTVPSRISLIDSAYNRYPAQRYPGYNLSIPLVNSNDELNFRIFAGPYSDSILKALDQRFSDPFKNYTPNYISVKGASGWFSFATEPFAKFLLIIMQLFYKITHSWGFSIILLTIVFRIMLYPLNSWSIKSTLQMQEITPLLKVIDAKYKKDPKQANIEKMKLFKEKGANPLSGCLPIIIQLPFLFGMFNLLKNTFELRGVPFIPGWIDNLTAPDVLFSWNYPLFLIGTDFHLLPILLGVVMFWQSKMNMKLPKDRSTLTDQQKQQIIMTWAMPLLFTFLFYTAASGLNIYFFFSMLLGILQQWYMSKKQKERTLKLIKK
jgi:YidC/Oxa1 family membrane protein insertase